jgi:hypothetical protein
MKYRYIIHFIEADRDRNMFIITDTRSGRSLRGRHVPENNVRCSVFYLNGQEHKSNYYFVSTQVTLREFKNWWVKNVPYIGSSPEEIAAAFLKMMKSRRPGAGRPVE